MDDASKTTWDLTPLASHDEDQTLAKEQEELQKRAEAFVMKWKAREDYLHKPEILKEALDDYEAWMRTGGSGGNGTYYYHLRTEQDESNPKLKAKYNQFVDAAKKIDNEVRFFSLNVAKIPKERQALFLAYSGLQKYRHYLGRSFAWAAHLMSEEAEKVASMLEATSCANWGKMVSGFLSSQEREILDEDGKKQKKTLAEIQTLLRSTQKDVRDSAAAAMHDIMARYADVAEHELNSILQFKKTDDELRGFTRPDASRHLSDDIESEVVDALVEAVERRNELAQRFYALKARLFGVKKLAYHERNVPYGTQHSSYSYEQASALIARVFAALEPAFASVFARFQQQRQIDVFPHKGKRGGAFCTNNLLCHPTYVMLNFTHKLSDASTIAHEMGHAINAELMRKQHALDYAMPLCTAEVASTFMEDFVLQELLREADDELRLQLCVEKLNNDISTIQRQVACYRFEQALHREFKRQGYLAKEEIGKLFQRYMVAYMGDAVEQSPGSENWWVSWHHVRAFFYVYSYASGLLISKALQRSVKRDKAFIGKVKEFLAAGASDSPRNIFKKLGIDIANKGFWDAGLQESEDLLRETEALAKKMGKIA